MNSIMVSVVSENRWVMILFWLLMNRLRIIRVKVLLISISLGVSGGRLVVVNGSSGEVVIIKFWNYSSLLDVICIVSFVIEGFIRLVSGLGQMFRVSMLMVNMFSISYLWLLMFFSLVIWLLVILLKKMCLYSYRVQVVLMIRVVVVFSVIYGLCWKVDRMIMNLLMKLLVFGRFVLVMKNSMVKVVNYGIMLIMLL